MATVTGAGVSAVGALLLRPGTKPLRRTQRRELLQWILQNHGCTDERAWDPSPSPVMPERDIRDPAPTVSVAYRVVQRPTTAETRKPEPTSVSTPGPKELADQWGEDPDQDW